MRGEEGRIDNEFDYAIAQWFEMKPFRKFR